jgi:thiol-disulfide isomerase/thioredoxin
MYSNKRQLIFRFWLLAVLINLSFPLFGQLLSAKDLIRMEEYFKQDTTFIKDSIFTRRAVVRLNFHFSSLPLAFCEAQAKRIPDSLRQIPESITLFEQIDLGRKLQPGQNLTDFEYLEKNGSRNMLSAVAGSHRLLLLDFWASWCPPCRDNAVTIRQLFTKYQQHGLSILGITIDKDEAAWKKAIVEDSMQAWHHGKLLDEELLEKQFGIHSRWKGMADLDRSIQLFLRK